MKKVLLNGLVIAALAVTAAVVTSCKSKGGGEAENHLAKTAVDDGTVKPPIDIGGTYKFGEGAGKGPSGSVMVYPLPDSSALFFLDVSRGAPSYNMGQLFGRMTINDNVGTYAQVDKYSNCILKFKFASQHLEIATEDGHGECGFGGNVDADNTYKLIDKSIPQYYLGPEENKILFEDEARSILNQTKTSDDVDSAETVKAEPAADVAKLLESMTTGEDSTVTFEYDEQSRIVKMHYYQSGKRVETSTLHYSGGNLEKITYEQNKWGDNSFEREENEIHTRDPNRSYAISVNEGGYITGQASNTGYDYYHEAYHYKGGNLTKITYDMSLDGDVEDDLTGMFTGLKYDDKKSPFSHCSTPRWFLQHYYRFGITFGLNNNVVEHKHQSGRIQTFEYEYDSDGFPTRRTMTEQHGDYKITETTVFTYIRQGDNL